MPVSPFASLVIRLHLPIYPGARSPSLEPPLNSVCRHLLFFSIIVSFCHCSPGKRPHRSLQWSYFLELLPTLPCTPSLGNFPRHHTLVLSAGVVACVGRSVCLPPPQLPLPNTAGPSSPNIYHRPLWCLMRESLPVPHHRPSRQTPRSYTP